MHPNKSTKTGTQLRVINEGQGTYFKNGDIVTFVAPNHLDDSCCLVETDVYIGDTNIHSFFCSRFEVAKEEESNTLEGLDLQQLVETIRIPIRE